MIYLVYSNDKDVVSKYIEDIVVSKKIDKDNVIYYDVNNDSIEDIILECNTYSMFSNIKIVVVNIEGILNNKIDDTKYLEYLDNYNKDVILINVCYSDKVDTRRKIYKKINEVGKIVGLTKDNNYLNNLVKNYLNDYKMEDINYFINKVGNNINDITNELDKLISYKLDNKYITKVDIDNIVSENINDEIFSLTNAIIKNDKKRAIKLYNHFKNNNYDETQMISLIASTFRFLLQVKILYNKGMSSEDIAKTLNVHPYRVKVNLNDLYYLDEEMLKDYLVKLCELDYKIKQGLVDKSTMLQLFILDKDK